MGNFSNSDKKKIVKLSEHFNRYGIIDRGVDSFEEYDRLEEIIDEANKGAKYEKELNPDFYDENLEQELQDKDYERINFMVNDYYNEEEWRK